MARGPHAVQQSRLEVGVAPFAETGLWIRREVGPGDIERGLVEAQAARQRLVELRAVRSHGRVAIVAGHHGVDEIAPALDRRLRDGGGRGPSREQSHETKIRRHDSFPALLVRTGSRRLQSSSSPAGNIPTSPDLPTSYHQEQAAGAACKKGGASGRPRVSSCRLRRHAAAALPPRLRPSPPPARSPCPSPPRRDRRTRSPRPGRSRRSGSRP